MVKENKFKEKHINFEPNKMLELSNRTDNTCVKKHFKAAYIQLLFLEIPVFWNYFDQTDL